MPLFRRIVTVNVLVLLAGAAILAATPATVSHPIAVAEAVLLAGLLAVLVVVNVLLTHRLIAPLERLREAMRRVDPSDASERLDPERPPETAEVARAFNDMLDRLAEERRRSGRRALAAQEGERKRVAQELHDELGQAMTAHLLHLSRIAKRAPDDLARDLEEAQDDARRALDEIRRLASQLRPEALDDLGLASAVAALARDVRQRTGVRVRAEIDERVPDLSPEAELVVYRVAQEALTNAVRHSGSDRAELELRRTARGVVLRIRDQGTGMGEAPAGGGIRGMQGRADLIGATLAVESPDGSGVEVRLEVPEAEVR